jgi:autotransporter-associated beta strand protein
VIGGQIRDDYDFRDPTNTTPHHVTKSGTSSVTLTANNTFKGNFTITGGQVHVGGVSGAISAAAKIVIGNAGTLALDSGSITVPLIDNALQGDYDHDHQVNAADFTVWRDSFGQTGAGLAADGNGDGAINQADYDLWSGSFSATSGGALLVNGGTLKVPNITGDVTNSGGTLAPGTAPAVRTMGGALAENVGILQVMVGGIVPGTNFDQIQVGGATTLGGALTVQLVNSFVPTLNQSFQILTSVGSVSGTFTSLNLPSPGAGKAWQVQYGTNDVKLVIVAAGSAASISTNGTSSAGSGSHSGGALGPGPSVPEPSTLTILLLGCIPLKLVRRAGKRHISRRLLPCHA